MATISWTSDPWVPPRFGYEGHGGGFSRTRGLHTTGLRSRRQPGWARGHFLFMSIDCPLTLPLPIPKTLAGGILQKAPCLLTLTLDSHRCTGCTGFFQETTGLYSWASAIRNRIIAGVSSPSRSVPSRLSCASMFNGWFFSIDLPHLVCPLWPTLRFVSFVTQSSISVVTPPNQHFIHPLIGVHLCPFVVRRFPLQFPLVGPSTHA